MRRVGVGTVLAALLLWPTAPAGAQGSAVQDLPGCTATTLPNGDDDSSNPVPLGFTANFFGKAFRTVSINQNGNVTFDQPLGAFTPFDLATSSTPIVAPFFADVDTTLATSGLATYGQTTIFGHPAFCVTWAGVGYYNDHTDRLNTFQLLLVAQDDGGGLGNFDIVFNYNSVQWESGDASGGSGGLGGTSAAAGYSNADGDPAHSLVLPGSLQNGAFLDSNPDTGLAGHSSGDPQPGRYVFPVRNTVPPPPAFGKSANAKVLKGTVLVKTPGSGGFVNLADAGQFPFGSQLDTTGGTVLLTSAIDDQGNTQSGKFSGGVFRLLQRQKAHGRTDLKLVGGNRRSCRRKSRKVIRKIRGATAKSSSTGRALATESRKRKRKRAKFRTQGKYSAATVRGTIWGTIDRCDGTLTWVKRGNVTVRDFVRKRTVRVRAHHRYLARAPGH